MNCHLWNSLSTLIILICLCTADLMNKKQNLNAGGCLENKNILSKYQKEGSLQNVELPLKLTRDNNLEVCSPPGANVSSCCTNQTEKELKVAASNEFKKIILRNTNAFSILLQENKDRIFDHYRSVTSLLVKRLEHHLVEELHLRSPHLSGSLSNLNRSLHIYLHQEVTEKQADQLLNEHLRLSFENIYENVFIYTLLKSQQSAGPQLTHFNCTLNVRMKLQLPQLQDLIRRINSLVTRTLSLTRTFVQAINISVQVFSGIRNLPLDDQCSKALARMAYCYICKSDNAHSPVNQSSFNYVTMFFEDSMAENQTYPCSGFCRNVVGGCLAHVIDVEYNWNMFVQNVKHLHAHMRRSPDVESLASTFHLKVADVVAHLRDNFVLYKQKIKDECNVDETMFIHPAMVPTLAVDSPITTHPMASLQLEDDLKKMSDVKWIFKSFPTLLCSPNNLAKCWNSTDFGSYQRTVPNLHIGNQIFKNPEMSIAQQPPIDVLKDKLEYINKKLHSKLLLPQRGDFGSGNADDEDYDGIDDDYISGGENYDEIYSDSGSTTSNTNDFFETKSVLSTITADFVFTVESISKSTTTTEPVYIRKDEPRVNLPPASAASNMCFNRSTFVFAATAFIFVNNFDRLQKFLN